MIAPKNQPEPTSLGERIYVALAEARASTLEGKLTRSEWIALANRVIKEDGKGGRGPKLGLGAGMEEPEWIEYLQAHPLLNGVDVEDEIRRCRVHFGGKLDPSRMRIVKWLAKSDRKSGSAAAVAARAAGLSPHKEPASEWRGAAARVLPDCDLVDRIRDGLSWDEVPLHVREKIVHTL